MTSVNDETFRLLLDGHEVPIASSYKVRQAVMEVPSRFEMKVGHAGMTAELFSTFPPFTPFELYVGDVLVQSGELVSFTPTGSKGTEVTLAGSDLTKWLVDRTIRSERTFAEKTFSELTEIALAEVGLGDRSLVSDNTANRKAITGVVTVKNVVLPTTEGVETPAGDPTSQRKVTHRTIKGEVGTTWFEFLRTQYKRAGLFLWAANGGDFILSRPNGEQIPTYEIIRRRESPNGIGDVTIVGQPSFSWDSSNRYTDILVTGRTGGRKGGRGTVSGLAFDREMVDLLNPGISDGQYDRLVELVSKDRLSEGEKTDLSYFRRKDFAFQDTTIKTNDQAAWLARRKLSESRRAGWQLRYTVAGHTAPSKLGGGRAVWAPDTVVHVVDDELGIEGPMWIESCSYSRSPQTETELRLMRIEDLLFAEEDFDRPPKLSRRKGVASKKPDDGIRIGTTEAFRVESMWARDPQWGGLPTQIRKKPGLRKLK